MRLYICAKNLLNSVVSVAALSCMTQVQANEAGSASWTAHSLAQANLSALKVKKRYALGIGRFDLDAHTEIIGWRLNRAWYFGRQDGLDSGLTLVWQSNDNQISLSKDGVRLTHRF